MCRGLMRVRKLDFFPNLCLKIPNKPDGKTRGSGEPVSLTWHK